MPKLKIKKGDTVVVTAGKDRGKQGKVLEAKPAENRIVVDGVNVRKKHIRARQQGQQGQTVEAPGAIPVSNAKVVCSNCGTGVRVSIDRSSGARERMCKKCGQKI